MAIAGYIVAGIFALGVIIALVIHFGWSISTQHRDHGVVASGSLPKRRVWLARRPRAHAGPVNTEALPTEPAPVGSEAASAPSVTPGTGTEPQS